MTRYAKLSVVCLLTLFLGACGDEPIDDGPGPVVNPDTGPAEDAGVDADSGVDAGFDADIGDEDTGDGGDGGGPAVEGSSCAVPTSLGSLAAGQEHSFNATLVEPSNSLDTTCDLGSGGSGVHVFAVEVDVTSRVEFWTSVSPSVLDLREGDCTSPNDVLTCTDGGRYTATLTAGETYHLAVWGDISQSDFELRATVQEVLCNVDEPNWCEAGELNECRGGTRIDTYSCVDDCTDETTCRGDGCDSAVALDFSSTSSASYTGQLSAYTSTWTADQKTGCAFNTSGPGGDTPHAEIIFEASGLTTGQQLSVSSLDPGDFAFFVLDTCGADSCIKAVDSDDSGDQRMTFEVPADGSYTVIIESLAGGRRDVHFQFEVQ